MSLEGWEFRLRTCVPALSIQLKFTVWMVLIFPFIMFKY